MLAKAAGAEPFGQLRDQKLHAVVVRSTCRKKTPQRRSALEVGLAGESCKQPMARGTCQSQNAKKAQVARSTFRTLFVQNAVGAPACL